MFKYFNHGWQRTFTTMGGWSWFYSLIAVPVIGFILHYYTAGEAAMNAELDIWLVYGLASAGLVFFAILGWNIASAPYRIEREKCLELENSLKKKEDEVLQIKSSIPPDNSSKVDIGWINSLPYGSWEGNRYTFGEPISIKTKLPFGVLCVIPLSSFLKNKDIQVRCTFPAYQRLAIKKNKMPNRAKIELPEDIIKIGPVEFSKVGRRYKKPTVFAGELFLYRTNHDSDIGIFLSDKDGLGMLNRYGKIKIEIISVDI